MLYSSQLIQKQQSFNVQNVKFVAELLFPIFDEGSMASYKEFKEQLTNILGRRAHIIACMQSASYVNEERIYSAAMKAEISISNQNIQMYNVPVHEFLEGSDMLVGSTWKKGMATMISETLGTTRQNIDKHIRLGKVEENRSIDFSIACWIVEEFGNE